MIRTPVFGLVILTAGFGVVALKGLTVSHSR
jgi:hypothetical protein